MTIGAVLAAQWYKLCHKSCFDVYEAGIAREFGFTKWNRCKVVVVNSNLRVYCSYE